MVEERADRVEQEPNALAVENFQWAKFPNRSNLLEMDWLFALKQYQTTQKIFKKITNIFIIREVTI